MPTKSARKRTVGTARLKRARSRPPIEDFPEPNSIGWDEPTTFHEALDLHIRRHGDTAYSLRRAIVATGDTFDWTTIRGWRSGQREPRSVGSLELLARIEARYRLPEGYFRAKLAHRARGTTGFAVSGVKPSERRRLVWHLPDDFDRRLPSEQAEILEWVRRVVVSGATDYRRYQALAIRDRYGLRFGKLSARVSRSHFDEDRAPSVNDPERAVGRLHAPPDLQEEMKALVHFKTATLTEAGFKRSGVWGGETVAQKVEHLSLLFGALSAPVSFGVRGHGIHKTNLTFAMLVFPAVWDWYVQWRERRRGFYTAWEVDMLRVALALTRREFGWLRQSAHLASRLRPIPGLIELQDIEAAQLDWEAACDRMYSHGLIRAKEVERVARVHRDPFEPILPVLESDSPLGQYRAITEEILRRLPDERRYPRCAAETVRSFLMLRIGLHLGVRQKNLRQLQFRYKGDAPTPERTLESQKRGELRWSERDNGWEVLIPALAFKNANSSYFSQKPFRLLLPDLGGLYGYISDYLCRHRARLLNGADDPGTFFVKTVKVSSRSAAYDQTTFYEAWRLTISRYGVFNPYTGRGAIKGLLPHGPHNLRDVLATHILKRTGSYEQASYAIQDTPETVARHYGRFLPQDKAALAAKILNSVWEDHPT